MGKMCHCKMVLNRSVELEDMEAGEMSQWVKVLAAEKDNLSSVPRTHVVEGENRFLQVFL